MGSSSPLSLSELMADSEFREGVAWLLRREAGQCAHSARKLTVELSLPVEHVETLATADAGYIVADSISRKIVESL